MKLHEIKIDAQFVDAKTEGLKYFEIRKCGCRYYDIPKFIKQWLESECDE